MTPRDDGPSLEQYIETRFNLMLEAVKTAQTATDLRYQQRFEAQSDALSAAFLSQQTAMKTAFDVAEKAVNAALAAADRAVSKAELAADKRFEGVNEFRETLADQQRTLMPRSEVEVIVKSITERLAKLENLLTARGSEGVGVKSGWAYAVGVGSLVLLVLALVAAAAAFWARTG